MKLIFKYECSNIDWDMVSYILKDVGMAYYDGSVHKKAFENSFAVAFAYDEDKLVGFGRVISDGVYQAAMYDIAVLPAYQGNKIGSSIIEKLLEKISECNIILYASPGKEEFYKKYHFRKLKTGMALFKNSEKMTDRGIIC